MAISDRSAIATLALSSLSHEINNALQSIDGGNDLIQEALRRQQLDEVEQVWRMVQHKQQNLSNIIQDLLFLSQAAIARTFPVTLQEIVARTIRATASQAEFCRVAVRCNLTGDLCHKLVYPEILQRCLYNILDASIQACAENPGGQVSVDVDVDRDASLVVLRFVDDGKEMSEVDVISFRDPIAAGDLFNRFGVSMAVAQSIARELGGSIDIKNNSGAGCTTTVTLESMQA